MIDIDKEQLLMVLASIIYRFEQGDIAVYEEANELIELLGGNAYVERHTHISSALGYIQALVIKAIVERRL
jgi:hypothetical protein